MKLKIFTQLEKGDKLFVLNKVSGKITEFSLSAEQTEKTEFGFFYSTKEMFTFEGKYFGIPYYPIEVKNKEYIHLIEISKEHIEDSIDYIKREYKPQDLFLGFFTRDAAERFREYLKKYQ